ncbi:GntR family transcriptional regulator [Actinoplanes sp. L3-i22]|uniref:GntR family transcriptional regulator n=1 Tax=Actinoplanes sp. L3-i22 TaxID=2836373 RepID=UPI001C79031E|nr:GntR family transcriptional regulator [Actinoplanes sp. L3-i22]BCY06158.1 putative HTH-type transcriptional regulator YurK [Actinoplanes sp. L3-i22]
MAYEIPTPKYLRVLNALRGRIEDGTYAPGAGLPSESQLCTEFDVSRPTVLKALGILKQDGWIESQQGKGSFVRGRPPSERNSPQYAGDAIDLDETAETEILHVGPVLAVPWVSAALGIPEGTPVYERRRRTISSSGPIDLISTFVPVDIAVGTDVIRPDPISGSILEHITSRKRLRADYATELLTARRVDEAEAVALDVPADEAVLSVVVTVHQSTGEAIMASLIVMPGSRHEIEDSYPLS